MMADMFDYIHWRGDIPFSQVSVNPVDALIFSTLVYAGFEGIVPGDMNHPVPLHAAAKAFLALPEHTGRIRVRSDLPLISALMEAPRFRDVKLCCYRDLFLPEEQTQFAAMGCLLDDGSAFLAFRGTDYSLVGWKEDFNMSFQDSVPAQREAQRYTEEFAALFLGGLHLGGHSKGGNLAVFAAARCAPFIQNRILDVYNNDGPGFTDYLMGDPGYIRMVPKIHTYIPESSIIGMLLEHEEPYSVIKSSQISLMQHEPYSWEVFRGDFIHLKEISAENRFANQAIKTWLAGMSRVERSNFVDTIYELLTASGADSVEDLMQPKTVRTLLRTLNADETKRNLLTGELLEFLKAVVTTAKRFPANRETLALPE